MANTVSGMSVQYCENSDKGALLFWLAGLHPGLVKEADI